MGGKLKDNPVPSNVNVGMMLSLLRQFGDPVYEPHRRRKVNELESPPNCGTNATPAWNGNQGMIDLSIGKSVHSHIVPGVSSIRNW
jgi:hypothetical protein